MNIDAKKYLVSEYFLFENYNYEVLLKRNLDETNLVGPINCILSCSRVGYIKFEKKIMLGITIFKF